MEILRDLRKGEFDVLVGVNLLREGLDLPEVSLVAILDADKEGFLRSETSLIQTIGRAARNVNAKVILYADTVTDSMQRAIDETDRRRARQEAFNLEQGITPRSITKQVREMIDGVVESQSDKSKLKGMGAAAQIEAISEKDLGERIKTLERQMLEHARNLEFEQAARVRDQLSLCASRHSALPRARATWCRPAAREARRDRSDPCADGVHRQHLPFPDCRGRVAAQTRRRRAGGAGRSPSAGTVDYTRLPPDHRAQQSALRRGYDLSRQRARQLRADDFERFDLLLAMDTDHVDRIVSLCPAPLAGRIRLLMDFSPTRRRRHERARPLLRRTDRVRAGARSDRGGLRRSGERFASPALAADLTPWPSKLLRPPAILDQTARDSSLSAVSGDAPSMRQAVEDFHAIDHKDGSRSRQ